MNRGRINQGILLVLIGAYFLLRNLGWVNDSFLHVLWSNWPILLIFAGLYVMLSKSRLWFIPALLSIVLFLALIGIGPQLLPAQEHTATKQFAFDIPADVNQVALDVEAAALELTLRRGDPDAITGQIFYLQDSLSATAHQEDEQFLVELHHKPNTRWTLGKWRAPKWQVDLPGTLPTDIHVEASAGNMTLDMRGIDARFVDISASAANMHLMFDTAVTEAVVSVEGSASNVEITVPEGIGLRIRSDASVGTNNLSRLGFDRNGDWYVSPDYAHAERRIDAEVTLSVGNLTVYR